MLIKSNSYTNLLILIFDVTDTSTIKYKLDLMMMEVSVTYDGHINPNRTFATFIKLGDTSMRLL